RHREAAEDLAQAAGLAGTDRDPRPASYALPGGLADPAVAVATARDLETAVAGAHAAALGRAPDATARPGLLEGFRTAADAAAGWGATPVAFPGRPDLDAVVAAAAAARADAPAGTP
uniref:DUF4439 domain-containing protein n=1 Tax=Cellulomonas endophytica TaxID=2494735 RepID=UPI001012D7EE